jgi:predicted DNA-binding WGR domain protein
MYSFVIDQLAPNQDYQYASIQVHHLKQAFEQNNLNAVKAIINTLFADLPYALFETDRKTSERFYHSLIHLLFKYLGVYIESEVHTSFGRADSVVQTSTDIYIFEFKHNDRAENALAQIIDKKYADKYRMQHKTIHGIGVNFNFETRSIDGWLTELL